MSEEEKELLARIGQLAGKQLTLFHSPRRLTNEGQINRHKNRQVGAQAPPNQHPAHHRRAPLHHSLSDKRAKLLLDNVYRHSSAPYPPRGHRVTRPPTVHRHRTLQLNSAQPSDASSSAASPASGTSGWVSKNDRHRQLINANVYEKEAKNRTKAIEETRQRKLNGRRQHEKTQLNNFLKQQAAVPDPTNIGSSVGRNEIAIHGIRFNVMDGGKKLVKVAGKWPPRAWCVLVLTSCR